jgi:hypothetical protein
MLRRGFAPENRRYWQPDASFFATIPGDKSEQSRQIHLGFYPVLLIMAGYAAPHRAGRRPFATLPIETIGGAGARGGACQAGTPRLCGAFRSIMSRLALQLRCQGRLGKAKVWWTMAPPVLW